MDETPCPLLNTRKRFFISIVGLVLSIIIRPIPITAQQSAERQRERNQKQSPSQPANNPEAANQQSRDDLRGTDSSPIVVKVLPTPKTDAETAQEKQDHQDQSAANWWMVKLTGAIMVIGLIQSFVFALQARRLRQTILKMEEIGRGQTDDMRASIGEATRAATAMEGIATSLVSSVQSARESVGITREIADRQKTIMELGGRAYLSAGFNASIYQDANHVFEATAFLANRGSTPAYDVTFRASVDILPFPIPKDFEFPLPDETAGPSVSLIAPGLIKTFTRPLSRRVPDDEVDAIKQGGPPQCFVMWGIVNYRDAFKEPRYVKFAFKMFWIGWVEGMDRDKDGNPKPPQMMSEDTNRHNEAN
jgi:hypothetical protein